MKYILITHGSQDEDILHSVSIITEVEKFKRIEESDKTVYFENIKFPSVKYKDYFKKIDYTDDPDIVVMNPNSTTFDYYYNDFSYVLYVNNDHEIYKTYENLSKNKIALLKLKSYLNLDFKVVIRYSYEQISKTPPNIRTTSINILTKTGIGGKTKLVTIQSFVEYLHEKTKPISLSKENLESIGSMVKQDDSDSLLVGLEMLANSKYDENQMQIGYILLNAVYKLKRKGLDKYLNHTNLASLFAYYGYPNTYVKRRNRGGMRVWLAYLDNVRNLFYHPNDKEIQLLQEKLEESWTF